MFSKKLKVLQISKFLYPAIGGIEKISFLIAQSLSTSGFEIYEMGYQNNQSEFNVPGEENIVSHSQFSLNQKSPLSCFPFSFDLPQKLQHLLTKNSFSHVLLHLPHPQFSKVLKIIKLHSPQSKIIGIYHSDTTHLGIPGQMFQSYFNYHQSYFSYFICSSESFRESSPFLKRLNDKKVKILPFSIPLSNHLKFQPSHEPSISSPLILIGRNSSYKGFNQFIKAISTTNHSLNIIGPGHDQKSKRSNIHYLGPLSEEDKYFYISRSQLLVLPARSRAESLGLCVLDAFSCGVPVVVSELAPGACEIVIKSEAGVILDFTNSKSYLNKIDSLLQNSTQLTLMKIKAKKYFENHHGPEKFTTNLLQILNHST